MTHDHNVPPLGSVPKSAFNAKLNQLQPPALLVLLHMDPTTFQAAPHLAPMARKIITSHTATATAAAAAATATATTTVGNSNSNSNRYNNSKSNSNNISSNNNINLCSKAPLATHPKPDCNKTPPG